MRFVLFVSFTLLFTSCKKLTIEQQVEKLMQTEEYIGRQEIAYDLADSLSRLPITLLGELYNKSEYPHIALTDMLTRYDLLLSKADIPTQKTIINLVETITSSKIPVAGLNREEKLSILIKALDTYDPNQEFKTTLIKVASDHGKSGLITLVNKWYENKSQGLILEAIKSFKYDAVSLLIKDLGSNENAEELLAYIGAPAVDALMSKMKSKSQKVRFSAADVLVRMSKFNPDAVKNLTDVIDSESLGAISKNYPFYIRLGSPGTEELLLSALESNFNRTMCVDYLNCGNSKIEDGAKFIANINGFNVFVEEGFHSGPKWGSEN